MTHQSDNTKAEKLGVFPFVVAGMSFIPLLGVVSGIALALYMTAHRLLPLGLFGLLSYVEPILLLLAAMLLGERIQPGQEVMYFLIAAAVVVMAFEGLMQLRNKPGAS